MLQAQRNLVSEDVPQGSRKDLTRDYERLLEGGLGARVARFIQQIWDEALQEEQGDK